MIQSQNSKAVGRKLKEIGTGLYQICDKLDNRTYQLQSLNNKIETMTQAIHDNQLKHYIEKQVKINTKELVQQL